MKWSDPFVSGESKGMHHERHAVRRPNEARAETISIYGSLFVVTGLRAYYSDPIGPYKVSDAQTELVPWILIGMEWRGLRQLTCSELNRLIERKPSE